MKRYKILVAAPAEAEIEEAYRYIRTDSPANAAAWRAGLQKAAESLQTFPKRCGFAPESGALKIEIRQFSFGNHRMLFTIRADAVVILHVRHAARKQMEPQEFGSPGAD